MDSFLDGFLALSRAVLEVERLRASNAELLEALEGLYTTFQQSNDFRPDSKIARQARAAFARALSSPAPRSGHE